MSVPLLAAGALYAAYVVLTNRSAAMELAYTGPKDHSAHDSDAGPPDLHQYYCSLADVASDKTVWDNWDFTVTETGAAADGRMRGNLRTRHSRCPHPLPADF